MSSSALPLWQAPPDRVDPIALLEEQNRARLPWLIPERHRRMAENAFAWFRGTAALMALDLGSQPHSGLEVQLCGDAHLLNFGFYASPERTLVFDINDFDETARGPFEWDLKRLLVSVVLVARRLGMEPEAQQRLARKVGGTYRKTMAAYADLPTLELWTQLLQVQHFAEKQRCRSFRDHLEAAMAQARRRSGRRAVGKFCERNAEGQLQIRHQPPLLWRHVLVDHRWLAQPNQELAVAELMAGYRASLQAHRRHLISAFQVVDTAFKAVGVGSVGTRCSIALLQGPHPDDLLLVQSKQALPSCVAVALGRPVAPEHHQGQRVVQGQRLLQAVSDPFLGWTTTPGGLHTYWRQLHDWKASLPVETMEPDALKASGRLCAAVLARAHARSGDRWQLRDRMGGDRSFETELSAFAVAYADQVEADHRLLLQALAAGRLKS